MATKQSKRAKPANEVELRDLKPTRDPKGGPTEELYGNYNFFKTGPNLQGQSQYQALNVYGEGMSPPPNKVR